MVSDAALREVTLNPRVQGPNPAVPIEPERASAISR